MLKYLIALMLAAPAVAAPVIPDAAIEVKAAFICADGREVEVQFRRPTQVALIDGPNGQIVLYKTVVEKGYRYIGGENEVRGDGDLESRFLLNHDVSPTSPSRESRLNANAWLPIEAEFRQFVRGRRIRLRCSRRVPST